MIRRERKTDSHRVEFTEGGFRATISFSAGCVQYFTVESVGPPGVRWDTAHEHIPALFEAAEREAEKAAVRYGLPKPAIAAIRDCMETLPRPWWKFWGQTDGE